ncbi:MAG: nucleotide exchange factor GrpE [Candidatus Doudnabacteria bacterium RIFCSPHIGHO2_02_FULL_46_11]|uniref:Protein GrpE n=1 Tax=Candidatus Doudnabacteria bacterium RIFCSPHIGHO2_02_FULL_46_11 TaxID=1817832 RepID=A0A1F5P6R5_9BACT|nr:MAG: nucleotide exchange factor GrpE [Candidatus Doudnabacteria bacterium RIFCSPHIGHO2_02_FULL_46_11]
MDEQQVEDHDFIVELAEVKKLAEDNLKGWQRAVADFENYKRRNEGHHRQLVDFAENRIIIEFLKLAEDLDRLLEHVPAEAQGLEDWKRGLVGVRKRLHDTLDSLGVKHIKTVGEKFDPELHEAVGQVEGDEDGLIAEEISPGYKRGDRLLKVPQVKVYKRNS